MYFLLDACQHPTFLRVLYFGYLFWEILAVVIPIGLIIMLMIDFTKAVVISKEDEQIKSMKIVGKRIMYAVFIFATPWLVSFIMTIIDSVGIDIGGDYNLCINTVKAINEGTDNIEKYDKLLKAEEEKEKLEKSLTSSNVDTGTEEAVGNTYKEAALAMVNLAKGELGEVGGQKYGCGGLAWCACFVNWLTNNTMVSNVGTVNSIITKEGPIGGCSGRCAGDMIKNFSSHTNLSFYNSKFYGGDYTPKAGDIIFFWSTGTHGGRYWNKTLDDAGDASHIGIVESYSNGKVNTIEGNSSNKVQKNTYDFSSDYIMGYGSWYKEANDSSNHTSGKF